MHIPIKSHSTCTFSRTTHPCSPEDRIFRTEDGHIRPIPKAGSVSTILVEGAISAKDLCIDGVLNKMPEHIPRRPVDRSLEFTRTLERLAAAYRRWAARTEARLRAK